MQRRRVKCQITKEYGYNNQFFKAPNNKYYKTQEIYDEYEFEMKCFKIIRGKILDLMGYKNEGQMPTFIFKEIGNLYETFSYDIILKTLNCKLNNIQYSLRNNRFNNEFAKAKYIFAIIKNSINDVAKNYSRKNKTQQSIENTNIELDIINNIQTNTKKHKDISMFLDEED